ncbi:MAG TPA: Asp-tRNA(Asn)/Glu-tRNA(Gln) amidotransferase subunit GatB [Chloroflexota bacterium]|nr:Asp-tRNA(Asn)/Glu-tRNA(Gln) amidotransferase subunit GatB [Chloroflexota bacterium]
MAKATTPRVTYEPVIGLEVHAQIATKSKMFCGCSAAYFDAPPNTHVCPVCLGMPGVLPVMNRVAVESMIMTALALNCEIPEASKFDRKNYFYPDLPKGYQISQYDLPFSRDGWLTIEVDGVSKRVGIERVHQEEDTGRLLHRTDAQGRAYTLVDFNRSGVPLMEIVGKPDLRSPAEARAYLQKLHAILQTLGISSGHLEEGAFRCDANISLRPVGATEFGTKTEIKNMNSFRSVYRALEYEIARQTAVLEEGGRITQETRGWMDDRGVTVSQRSKEFAHDYRYFPEPDLPPVFVSREWVAELRARLPELPDARRERYQREYGLNAYDAAQLSGSPAVARYFERAVALYPNAKVVANWVQGELFRLLPAEADPAATPLTPEHLAELLGLVERGVLSQALAKQVLEEAFESGARPEAIVQERGLAQISDTSELERIVAEVLAANPQPVADYRAGKETAANFLKGQVMKATRGKANPAVVTDLLTAQLRNGA